ncbi:uncharacterized protein STEHIDRAFT_114235 [Stereum hirsutum FP-91666 SS1]|uniref:uncharacterized protein n=1 Tax=Stereum hirsutum (strain FP-91666) TaxID=721885 RepID=UPI0004449D54|nr:uncharacterized protein STEHIDRAFT_114235 [Stereum hirsutum FP-91666 SS1]EIM82294.1 hypothetical protein STEHIDRAFT_114235 [Stereum hirsutum FP-91666 SS1]
MKTEAIEAELSTPKSSPGPASTTDGTPSLPAKVETQNNASSSTHIPTSTSSSASREPSSSLLQLPAPSASKAKSKSTPKSTPKSKDKVKAKPAPTVTQPPKPPKSKAKPKPKVVPSLPPPSTTTAVATAPILTTFAIAPAAPGLPQTTSLIDRLTPAHRSQLSLVWIREPRVPSIESRRAWALAKNVNPKAVNDWFWRRKAGAKRRGSLGVGVGGVEVVDEEAPENTQERATDKESGDGKEGVVKVEDTEGMKEATETKSNGTGKGKEKAKKRPGEGYELGVDEPVGWVDPTTVVKEEPKVVEEEPTDPEPPVAMDEGEGRDAKRNGKMKTKGKGKGKRVRIQDPEKDVTVKSVKKMETEPGPPPRKRPKLDVDYTPALSASRYHTRSAATALAAFLPPSPPSPSLSVLAPASPPRPSSPVTDLDTQNDSDHDEETGSFPLALPPSFALLPKARTRSRIFRAQLSSPRPPSPRSRISATHISTLPTPSTHTSTSLPRPPTHIPTHPPHSTHISTLTGPGMAGHTHISTYPDSEAELSAAHTLRDLRFSRHQHVARPRSTLKFSPGRIGEYESEDDDYAYIHPDPPSDVTEPDNNSFGFSLGHIHDFDGGVDSLCSSRFGQSFVERPDRSSAIDIFGRDGNGIYFNDDRDKDTDAVTIDSASSYHVSNARPTNDLRPISYSPSSDTSFSTGSPSYINTAPDSAFTPIYLPHRDHLDTLLSPVGNRVLALDRSRSCAPAPSPAFASSSAPPIPVPYVAPSYHSMFNNHEQDNDSYSFTMDTSSSLNARDPHGFFAIANRTPFPGALVSASETASIPGSSSMDWTSSASGNAPLTDVSMSMAGSGITSSDGAVGQAGVGGWVNGYQNDNNYIQQQNLANYDNNGMLDPHLYDPSSSFAPSYTRAPIFGLLANFAEHAGAFSLLFSDPADPSTESWGYRDVSALQSFNIANDAFSLPNIDPRTTPTMPGEEWSALMEDDIHLRFPHLSDLDRQLLHHSYISHIQQYIAHPTPSDAVFEELGGPLQFPEEEVDLWDDPKVRNFWMSLGWTREMWEENWRRIGDANGMAALEWLLAFRSFLPTATAVLSLSHFLSAAGLAMHWFIAESLFDLLTMRQHGREGSSKKSPPAPHTPSANRKGITEEREGFPLWETSFAPGVSAGFGSYSAGGRESNPARGSTHERGQSPERGEEAENVKKDSVEPELQIELDATTFILVHPEGQSETQSRPPHALTIDDLLVIKDAEPDATCQVSVQCPIRALQWLMQNNDHPLIIMIRENGIGGPLPFMLFPDTEALALFGLFDDSNVIEAACELAQLSKISVVVRPTDDYPKPETESSQIQKTFDNISVAVDDEELHNSRGETLAFRLRGGSSRGDVSTKGKSSYPKDVWPRSDRQHSLTLDLILEDIGNFGTPTRGTTARDVHGFPLLTDADAQVSIGELQVKTSGTKIDLDTRSYGHVGVIAKNSERWFTNNDFIHHGHDIPDVKEKRGEQRGEQQGLTATMGGPKPIASISGTTSRSHLQSAEYQDEQTRGLTGSLIGYDQVVPQWIVKQKDGFPDEVKGRSFKSFETTYYPHDQCRERNKLKVSFGQAVKMKNDINIWISNGDEPVPYFGTALVISNYVAKITTMDALSIHERLKVKVTADSLKGISSTPYSRAKPQPYLQLRTVMPRFRSLSQA